MIRLIVMALIVCLGGVAYAGNPYAIQGGLQGLDHEGERIRAIRIPVYLTVRHWQDGRTGLRLRMAGTFAVNDLDNLFDQGLDQIRMVSIMPGLELVTPFGRNHLVRPFLDVGLGSDSRSDTEVLLVSGGARTEFIFTGRHFFTGLEPGFQVANRSGVDQRDDAVFNPFVTISARRVLGFRIDGHQPDGGVYFEAGYDFNAVEFSTIRSTRDAINTNLEIGVGFGFSQTRPRILFFHVPRIRVGYRFGDLQGWRIRLGGDWLTRVVGLNTPAH